MLKGRKLFSARRTPVHHRLFQAAMYRRHVLTFDGQQLPGEMPKDWLERILQVNREDCMRLAKANAYMAHRVNRYRQRGVS